MRPALVCGIFDLLHYGHLRLIREAADLAPVTIGLLTDDLAASYKRQPIQTYWERERTLRELPWVEKVVEKDSHDLGPLIRELRPRYLVLGSDWSQDRFYSLNQVDAQYLELKDVTVVFIPNENVMSTTKIIERVADALGSDSPPPSGNDPLPDGSGSDRRETMVNDPSDSNVFVLRPDQTEPSPAG